MIRRIRVRCLSFAILALFVCSTGYSQIDLGTLRGTVTDPSGAIVNDAKVSVVDETTNIEVRRTTTDAHGDYEIPDVKPGTYRVTAEREGFRSFIAVDVLIDPTQIRRIDIKLLVGDVSDAVSVNAGAALIETQTGTISRQLDTTNYATGATVDINPAPLALLVTTPGMQGNGFNMVMSGMSSGALQTWEADGIAADISSGGSASAIAQLDDSNFFETVEASTANAGVDASRPVGFNLVSKHGANAFHGDVYWKEQNSALDAKKFFTPTNTPYILHSGETELSGPIYKNKTFFFAGFQLNVVPLGDYYLENVPTLKERSGDFSDYLNASTSPTGKVVVINNPSTGQPFPGNKILPSQINSVSQNYLQYYPTPNIGSPTTYLQNYGFNDLAPAYRAEWMNFRVDHQLTKNNTLFVRYAALFNPFPEAQAPSAQFDYTEANNSQQIIASDTWVLGPVMVNNITYGYTTDRNKVGVSYPDARTPLFGDTVVNAIGLQGVNSQGFHTIGFPGVSISGAGAVSSLSAASGCLGGLGSTCTINSGNTWKDVLTWSKGKHIMRYGGEYDYYTGYQGSISSSVYGSFAFTGTFTGSGFADFLLGMPSTATRLTDPVVGRNLHQSQVGLFGEDTWKVSPKLTLVYGVRWDYYGSPIYDDGLMYNFDPATGDVIVPVGMLSKVSPLYPSSITIVEGNVVPSSKLTNIRPRVSAAYRLRDSLVIRGGYGQFTVSNDFLSSGRVNGPTPFQINEAYPNVSSSKTPLYTFPDPFPSSSAGATVPSQSVSQMPMHTDEATIHQYNLTFEQQVGNAIGLRLSFVGLNGVGMNYGLNVDKPMASTIPFSFSREPYPQFTSVTEYRTDGSWHRQALQLEAQKRTGRYTFDSNVSWASNMENYNDLEDPYNVTNHWSRDATERRLYFVTSAGAALPFGKGQVFFRHANRIVNSIIGDWKAQAIATFTSGMYFTPTFTGPDPANASSGNVTQIADCIGQPYFSGRTITRWWNPASFATPPTNAGRYGNCAANILEGYPTRVGNLSLAKTWHTWGPVHTTFVIQASDIANTPTFTTPVTTITSSTFGAFTAVNPYYQPERDGFRQIDAALKIAW